MVETIPPSVLPDISPTRGEIDSWHVSPQTMKVEASGSAQPISPLVGEMPGKAEGGSATHRSMRANPHAH